MYSNRISRKNPTAFVFLIDQSGSMEELTQYDGLSLPKSEAVSTIINSLLREIINRSRREEGVRDYFDIAILGYHGQTVESLLPVGTDDFTSLSKLSERVHNRIEYKKEVRLPGGSTSVVVLNRDVWIEATAKDRTPMYGALKKAYEIVGKWCAQRSHFRSYPPTIFNITDGEASDGSEQEIAQIAEKIKSLGTEDGNVLLVNIHLSTNSLDKPVVFAASTEELPKSKYAKLLFEISSELPENYLSELAEKKGAPKRAFGFNAAMTDLVKIMNIGSVSVNVID